VYLSTLPVIRIKFGRIVFELLISKVIVVILRKYIFRQTAEISLRSPHADIRCTAALRIGRWVVGEVGGLLQSLTGASFACGVGVSNRVGLGNLVSTALVHFDRSLTRYYRTTANFKQHWENYMGVLMQWNMSMLPLFYVHRYRHLRIFGCPPVPAFPRVCVFVCIRRPICKHLFQYARSGLAVICSICYSSSFFFVSSCFCPFFVVMCIHVIRSCSIVSLRRAKRPTKLGRLWSVALADEVERTTIVRILYYCRVT
jgi:hypothetical protein